MDGSTTGLNRPQRTPWPAPIVVALCVAVAALLSACGGDEVQDDSVPAPAVTPTATSAGTPAHTDRPARAPKDATASDEVRSDRERAPAAASGVDLADFVGGNRAFAFDLLQALKAQDGNLFYSPHSISAALAMTYAGAGGETASQMAETLRFLLPGDRLHPAFNALDHELDSRGAGARAGERFRLNIVNAVWGQQGHPFRETFLDILAESYGVGVRPTDFSTAPEESRLAINDWVAERTEDKIRDLIPPGIINPLTRMVLTNAVYFNASWSWPFDEAETRDRPFHLLDGSSVAVPTMRTEQEFLYGAGDSYQAVDLPYAGRELSMTVIVPDQGRFEAFEDSLDAALVDRIIDDLGYRYVALELPRFEFESQFRLGEALKSMGMPDAFDSTAADFSGMNGRSCLAGDPDCLYIRAVLHKAFVSVDEAGTEAAAATAVVMQTESAKPTPVSVQVDRPFLFLIRDRETGAILFVGRVMEP